MKLVVFELDGSGLSQKTKPDKDLIISAIRPHLYRHKFATGNLTLSVYNGMTLIATSSPVNIADILPGNNYFHGYIRFDIDCYLQKDIEYTLKLTGGDGYSFDESAYIGWVNGSDLSTYSFDAVPTNALYAPLDYQMWELTTK